MGRDPAGPLRTPEPRHLTYPQDGARRLASAVVSTVRETTYDLLRSRGLTTVFGNPGSNELPFLDGFPDDFRYVLGLHEGAVLAMADGYAQATGRPALVNLHSAAGLGNAMGVLANTRAAGTPLVVTAGQQARAMIGLGSVLAEPAMTRVPEPQVKWAFEPARAQDVPRALSEALHLAALPPTGPMFVSLPAAPVRRRPAGRSRPPTPAADAAPFAADALFALMTDALPPDVRLVNESTAHRKSVRRSRAARRRAARQGATRSCRRRS